jgi:hypothetical protein
MAGHSGADQARDALRSRRLKAQLTAASVDRCSKAIQGPLAWQGLTRQPAGEVVRVLDGRLTEAERGI